MEDYKSKTQLFAVLKRFVLNMKTEMLNMKEKNCNMNSNECKLTFIFCQHNEVIILFSSKFHSGF